MIIAELRQLYPLKDLLKLSGLARSTFYYYLKSKYTDKYKEVKDEILDIFNQNRGRYGYRRILSVLKQKGYTINHKTVLKLMNELNIKGKQRKNDKYHSYKGEIGKIADNLLRRDFYASKPFEKLTTDVTELKVCDDKVYLSPVMDLYNREIVSYSISSSPNLWQIREMLDGLFNKLYVYLLDLCFTLIKAGNTNTWNINDYLKNITSYKVCPEKETVWITEQWKTSSAD